MARIALVASCRLPGRTVAASGLVVEAAAAAAPAKAARLAAGARVGGEGWKVPVGLEGVVPVGLVGGEAARLHVGTAGASAVTAAGAIAALAFAESSAVLTSVQDVRR